MCYYIYPYFPRTSNHVTQTPLSAGSCRPVQKFPSSVMTAAFQTKHRSLEVCADSQARGRFASNSTSAQAHTASPLPLRPPAAASGYYHHPADKLVALDRKAMLCLGGADKARVSGDRLLTTHTLLRLDLKNKEIKISHTNSCSGWAGGAGEAAAALHACSSARATQRLQGAHSEARQRPDRPAP